MSLRPNQIGMTRDMPVQAGVAHHGIAGLKKGRLSPWHTEMTLYRLEGRFPFEKGNSAYVKNRCRT